MSIEDMMKLETEKVVDTLKEKYKKEGHELSKTEELMFRSGILHGVMIAGVAITHIPEDAVNAIMGE